MKRMIAWLLLAATMVSLCACGAEPAQPAADTPTTTAAPTAAADSTPANPQEAPEATEAQLLEGNLYLKVSAVTFSVVGETDDIYLGLIPREEVTWESEDPGIVSVENGVLTATGVGTTTIHATYGDKQVSCTAGCLAATEEELHALDISVLCTPKRVLPEVDLEEACTYFDNAAIVGDSITYFLFQHESKTNYLGNMTFLARGGVSMNGFVRRFKNIYYKGKERHLEDAIRDSQVERVYFLMGSNDIIAPTQRPFVWDNWNIMLERIRAERPDIEIVLMSCIPLYGDDKAAQAEKFIEYNTLSTQYTADLKQFAEDNGCMWLDLNYYVIDHNGRMPQIYNQGEYHMNQEGCYNWMKILRYYAQYELEGGTLS